ncbi:hypothetical protein JX265_013149 [Neoarthrinium moseri]|uniref:Uncharacterized protein n=1 Tax=Neoarthrinium moseri TaxID=1658444 RepID=A0A9Q0AG51_9PEZI|nr:hypothetical protein JX266_012580 [Neoarthrinium moseri]KAI1851792.1 hypothetical protein JX265_013149 [Neoarthrinium moseri]
MDNQLLSCAICGSQVRPPISLDNGGSLDRKLEWQTHAVVLSDPAKEFETLEQHYRAGKKKDAEQLILEVGDEIRRDRATVTWSNTCVLAESGDEYAPNWLAGFDENNIAYETPYSIVAHEVCVDIALKVMRMSLSDIHVRSLRTLWKVLRTRFDARDNEYMGSVAEAGPQHVVMKHCYYLPSAFSDNAFGSDWDAADPSDNIPRISSLIISNLDQVEPESVDTLVAQFRQRFLGLPPELRDRVISLMGSSNGLSTSCTHLLPQHIWRDILLGGRYLPFLKGLECGDIDKKCQDAAQEGMELNWELLVRRLSRPVVILCPTGVLSPHFDVLCYHNMTLPDGLRNRRRIWQLVEEMFVGDVRPARRSWINSTHVPSMPRYWDEYGEPVYPVERIAAIPEI